jgi:hypothetical protein
MPGPNSRTLPGNGILSGLTLDAETSDPNGAAAQYDSPWDQAVRAAWEKHFAANPNIQGHGTPSVPLLNDWSFADPSRWGQQSNYTAFLGNGAANFSGWPHGYQPPPQSFEAMPASFRVGPRGWGNPVGPGPLFDYGPWRKQTTDGLRGLYEYLKSLRSAGPGTAEESAPDCQQEWSDARDRCVEEFAKPNPSRGITGGYRNIEDCARGLVSEACRGNPYSRRKEPYTRPYNTDD